MNNTLKILKSGFQSSSGKTPEFKAFCSTFKREFTKELVTVNAENVQFHIGHFYISGFATINNQVWYFNIGDVRGMDFVFKTNPGNLVFCGMMYRRADHYKDYRGHHNKWAEIEEGMALKMFENGC